MLFAKRPLMPAPEAAPPGRDEPILPAMARHAVLGTPLHPPYPAGIETAVFGLGCFWGAERLFWSLGAGIHTTAVGYAGGFTPNATYQEVCTGQTGHAEIVVVGFDPRIIGYEALLKSFWEAHDPTQGFRQGNDVGTQYRSVIFATTPEQLQTATASRAAYDAALRARGFGAVTTEIAPVPAVYLAEDYHQQYLHKVPNGYRCHANTGVPLPL